MFLNYCPSNTVLFNLNTIGDHFFILRDGLISLNLNGESKTILPGESFGELALLHAAPRNMICKTSKDCQFWCLSRKTFREIIDHVNYINFEQNKKFIQSIPILNALEDDQKAILCSNLLKEVHELGEYIVKEGDLAACIYIVKEGEVKCVSKGEEIRTLSKGDHFGEKSILLQSSRTMDVIAKTTCICYSISVETLTNMVGEKYKDLLYMNFIKMSFSQSQYFKRFNLQLLENAYELLTARNYYKRDLVYKAGHKKGSKLIIIIEGSLVNVIKI